MGKYVYTGNCREISGFGGGYEEACRAMVIRGMEWFDENPNVSPEFSQHKNITGIINPENPEAESLTQAMEQVAAGCTGAMMQAAVNHCMFAAKHGWNEYIKKMQETDE